MYLGAALVVRMPASANPKSPNSFDLTFSGITQDLGDALQKGGQPLRPDGSAYTLTNFQGGYLLDNCPLNVIFGNGFLPGQQEALNSAGLHCDAMTAAHGPIVPPIQSAPQVPTTWTPGPVITSPSQPTAVQAPGYTPSGGYTRSGAPIYPTGVQAPTPTQAATPAPGAYAPNMPPEPGLPGQAAANSSAEALPIIGLIAALGYLFGKSGRR